MFTTPPPRGPPVPAAPPPHSHGPPQMQTAMPILSQAPSLMPTPPLVSQAPPMMTTNPHPSISFSVPPPNLYPPSGPSLPPSVLPTYPSPQPVPGVPVWPSPFHTYPAYGYPTYLPHPAQAPAAAIPNYGIPPPGFAFPPPVAPLRPPLAAPQPHDVSRMVSDQRDASRDNPQRHSQSGEKHSSHDARDRSSSPRRRDDRHRRDSYNQERSKGRDSERSSSRSGDRVKKERSPKRHDERYDRRHPLFRDNDVKDRERERLKREKEIKEKIPSAYKKTKEKKHASAAGPCLVPYDDDSENDESPAEREAKASEEASRHSAVRKDDGYHSEFSAYSDSRAARRDPMFSSFPNPTRHADNLDFPRPDGREGRNESRRRDESRGRRGQSSKSRRSPSPNQVKIKKEIKQEPKDDYKNMTSEQILEIERKVWVRSAPADLYYERDWQNPGIMKATARCISLQDQFEKELIHASHEAKAKYPKPDPPKLKVPAPKCGDDSSDSEEEGHDHDSKHGLKVESLEWMDFRAKQVNRLHPELWQNAVNELNDGPNCRCSLKAQETGIRHGMYVGEEKLDPLDPNSNNHDKLHHYRITISPPTNFLIKHPTTINHDEHEFIFEGFSMFTREKLQDLPECKVVRFNIEYTILYFEEKMPENFTVRELELFHNYFFYELLELLDWKPEDRFFFMPRFVRDLCENGKEILSMNEVMAYMVKSHEPLVQELDLIPMLHMSQPDWQHVADKVKGMLVTQPGMQPSTIRVDQLDREQDSANTIKYPEIIHFGVKPPQLSYAGNQEYQKAWRDFVKFRHLLANMPKPTFKDRRDLESKENQLLELRTNTKLKRDCTVVVSAQGFLKTGFMTDIVQHALLIPVLVNHLRLHNSLNHLEKKINYTFKNRYLLQQAVTHPSYKENFGTNPDHVRNTLSNCGIRQPEYGDKRVHHQNTRKRGINMLINIMSRFGKNMEVESKVQHNERLEFLGDAVVEFVTSVHLFYMFPDLEEGGLATYRAAIVQNQHLAILADFLELDRYMLYAHGSDLCHDSELRHAMANCFEALMGAIFLDCGVELADKVFSDSMFGAEPDLFETWSELPLHPLQTQEPNGDRHWIPTYPVLQKMVEFEELTGIEFNHIRLLARAFTDRSIGFNNLTLGSNQRMEFLGDTVLQLITSDFLYKHFPDHHEGHLSLLRSSLVNNRTQSVVCDDLGMTKYAVYANPKHDHKIKDKADLLEAFLGALYVDQDLEYCQVFAHVCFFPRLQQFILNQDWNDPKSKLQQCCLTLRTMDGGEPDIPIYKVIECKGPTNTRVYAVAVYFRGERLAKDYGHSIQMAEMNAAKLALENCAHLFPHLNYQKRIMQRSFRLQGIHPPDSKVRENWYNETIKMRKKLGMDPDPEMEDNKNRVKQEIAEIEEKLEQKKGNGGNKRKRGKSSGSPGDKNHPKVKEERGEKEKSSGPSDRSNITPRRMLEEGECIDSEDDFDQLRPEEVALMRKENNKKRWGNDGQSTSTGDGAGDNKSKSVEDSNLSGSAEERKGCTKQKKDLQEEPRDRRVNDDRKRSDGPRQRHSEQRYSTGGQPGSGFNNPRVPASEFNNDPGYKRGVSNDRGPPGPPCNNKPTSAMSSTPDRRHSTPDRRHLEKSPRGSRSGGVVEGFNKSPRQHKSPRGGRHSPPHRMGQSPPRRMGLLGHSPPRRMGHSPPRRMGQSPPRRVGQSPPRRVGRSPRRMGQSPPRRMGQSPRGGRPDEARSYDKSPRNPSERGPPPGPRRDDSL